MSLGGDHYLSYQVEGGVAQGSKKFYEGAREHYASQIMNKSPVIAHILKKKKGPCALHVCANY